MFCTISLSVGGAAINAVLCCSSPPRPLPAVRGGDVRAVAAGAGRGGRLRAAPALGRVPGLPAVPPLRPLLHVCSRRHLLLLPGRPPLPAGGTNHPGSLHLTPARRWFQRRFLKEAIIHFSFSLSQSCFCDHRNVWYLFLFAVWRRNSVDICVTAVVWRSQALCSRIKPSQLEVRFEKLSL